MQSTDAEYYFKVSNNLKRKSTWFKLLKRVIRDFIIWSFGKFISLTFYFQKSKTYYSCECM